MEVKRKVGRPKKEPTKILHFRIPESRAEYIKDQIMKLIKKLLVVLVAGALLASCTKSDPRKFVKVTVDQGGESVMVTGYLQQPTATTWVYWIEIEECGVIEKRQVRVEAGSVVGTYHYQTNCKVGKFKIVYDDILRQ